MPTLRTGRQLQAARALAGYDRTQLAQKAGLTAHTIKRLELQARITANTTTVDAIEKALEEAGVELLNGSQPGCRMKAAA